MTEERSDVIKQVIESGILIKRPELIADLESGQEAFINGVKSGMFQSENLNTAIADRVRKLNPYSTVSLCDPSPGDVDKLIIEAAWQIQHPKREKKGKGKGKA